MFIPQSIYSIDESAFLNCTGLESIVVDFGNPKYDSRDNCNAIIETGTNKLIVGSRNTVIPQSVTDYGQYGLANCVKLTLPEGMDEIPINLLNNCKNLESITIPNSIKKIYDHSFDGCSSLKTIIIEDGTEELLFDPLYTYSGYKPHWFKDCPIDSIYLGRVIRPKYSEYDYLPFRELGTLRTIVLGDHIIDIPSHFFSGCTNLCSVRLSENTKSIGHSAFASCVNIQHINFNSQLETIGQYAFSYSNLNKIVIPSSVKSIGENAFGCSHLSCLIFEDGDEDVLLDGRDNMFWGNTIDSLYWGRNGPKINFRKIKHITLADVNIKSFGGITCDSVCVLSIKAGKEALSISLFRKDVIIDSVYCNRVLDVNSSGNHPLYLANSMFKLEIGKELTCIGDNMFYGCKIPSLFIPNNIKHISPTAFNNCNILSSVLIEDSTEPLDFGEGNNFYGCQLRDVYLGRNMEFSTNSPFNGNKEGIQKLTFGSNVTEIPDNTFAGLKNVKELTLPKNLKKVGSMAFYGCEGLTELTIPGSVTEIGQQAFDLCRNLKTLRLDDGETELRFTANPNYMNNAFQNSPLEEIYLGRNFSFTSSSPLAIFETLKSMTIGEDVSSLAERSFIGCPNLKDVTSYSKVVPTTIGNVFTPSYLGAATLHVPYVLYDEYKVANVWKEFGTIVNFEGLYNLVYYVDGEEYKKYVVEQGTTITPETAPYKEGYTFSGWSEIPATMPAHDVTVTGTFTLNTGIDQIMSNRNSGAMIFTIDGKRLTQPQRGLNIVRMSDGTTKKVVVK